MPICSSVVEYTYNCCQDTNIHPSFQLKKIFEKNMLFGMKNIGVFFLMEEMNFLSPKKSECISVTSTCGNEMLKMVSHSG